MCNNVYCAFFKDSAALWNKLPGDLKDWKLSSSSSLDFMVNRFCMKLHINNIGKLFYVNKDCDFIPSYYQF